MKQLSLLFVLILLICIIPRRALATAPVDPQYIIFIKAPTGGGPNPWISPETITSSAISEIRNTLQTDGTENRRLGVGYIIHFLANTIDDSKAMVQKILDLSISEHIPVFLQFVSAPMWQNRGDLWNWWDPGKPGYNPDNINNVEWSGWNSSTATKISWLNWGNNPIRMPPYPNFGSPTLLNEERSRLSQLIPIIDKWYHDLPVEKKYLFAGVSIDAGSIGIDGYYYPNGNWYLENYPDDSSHDPKYPLGDSQPFAQLGYAAVKDFGIRTSGSLTQDDINGVLQKRTMFLSKVFFDKGIPNDKIYINTYISHLNYNQTLTSFNLTNAMTGYGRPMAEFLQPDNVTNPRNDNTLVSSLNIMGQGAESSWAILGDTGNLFRNYFNTINNSLGFRGNKVFLIVPWEGLYSIGSNGQYTGIVDNLSAEGIRQALNNPIGCLVSPALINAQVSGNSAILSWDPGPNNSALYLKIARSADFEYEGTLKNPIANEAVTGKTTVAKSGLTPGGYYWQIISDGCTSFDGASYHAQRRIANGSFQIPLSDTANINGDFRIDYLDVNILLSDFPSQNLRSDLNNNGKVDIFDFNKLAGRMGK